MKEKNVSKACNAAAKLNARYGNKLIKIINRYGINATAFLKANEMEMHRMFQELLRYVEEIMKENDNDTETSSS